MPVPQRWDSATLRLIAITDSLRDGSNGLTARAFAAVHGGATMVLLRLTEESPRALCEVAHSIRVTMPHVPLIVNGRFDVALAAGAAACTSASMTLHPLPCGGLFRRDSSSVPLWVTTMKSDARRGRTMWELGRCSDRVSRRSADLWASSGLRHWLRAVPGRPWRLVG
jgi:hypothetical protein